MAERFAKYGRKLHHYGQFSRRSKIELSKSSSVKTSLISKLLD
jgi:hypothetical protein